MAPEGDASPEDETEQEEASHTPAERSKAKIDALLHDIDIALEERDAGL